MRSRRALLYVPGSDRHKIEKAALLEVDCVALDLEDGVAENMKDEARAIIRAALKAVNFGRSERIVRVNSFSSGRTADDLEAVLESEPDGILLPKVDDAQQIEKIDHLLNQLEKRNNLAIGKTSLIVIVESALGMVNLESICRISEAVSRFQAIIFGAEDFTADICATRTPEAIELLYARSRLVMYCAAFGLQAIDLVTTNFKDTELLEKESLQGAQMGYSGKQVIHPAQVEPVQRIFTPSTAEIENALKIIEDARRFGQAGKGAFAIEGQMIDRPVIKRAENILARAGIKLESIKK